MTDQTKHATRADIEAILAARKTASITVDKIPATPQPVPLPSGPVIPGKPVPLPSGPPITGKGVPFPQATPVPSLSQPATVAVTVQAPAPQVADSDVETFLASHLPGLIAATVALVQPPFAWGEVVQLGTAVSAAVSAGLPQVKGTEARVLVVVISRYLWRTYAVPALPATVRPFAGLLETLLMAGIEAAYQLVVKPKKAA